MSEPSFDRHPGCSIEQQEAQAEILECLECRLGYPLKDILRTTPRVELDGYHDGEPPTCVEVFSHVGKCKDGQRKKIMRDMCRLLLAERLIGRPCKKIIAVCSEATVSFLRGSSWQARFAIEFGIDVQCVQISEQTTDRLLRAQRRQQR